jgi:hypothetical protein
MIMFQNRITGEIITEDGGEIMNELPEIVSQNSNGFKDFITNKNTIYGILIGVGIGAIANVVQFYAHKKQREKMLSELNWTIDAFESALINNFSIADPSGKIVDINAFRVENTDEFIAVMHQEMYKNRKSLKGDERLKWITALERLVKLAQKVQLQQVARNEA